jgi:hypothetical protein
LLAHEDYSNISNYRRKILAILREIFITFFPIFQNSCVFIPLSLSEPQTVFCGTLTFRGTQFEKHCCIGLLSHERLLTVLTKLLVTVLPSQATTVPTSGAGIPSTNPISYFTLTPLRDTMARGKDKTDGVDAFAFLSSKASGISYN